MAEPHDLFRKKWNSCSLWSHERPGFFLKGAANNCQNKSHTFTLFQRSIHEVSCRHVAPIGSSRWFIIHTSCTHTHTHAHMCSLSLMHAHIHVSVVWMYKGCEQQAQQEVHDEQGITWPSSVKAQSWGVRTTVTLKANFKAAFRHSALGLKLTFQLNVHFLTSKVYPQFGAAAAHLVYLRKTLNPFLDEIIIYKQHYLCLQLLTDWLSFYWATRLWLYSNSNRQLLFDLWPKNDDTLLRLICDFR